MRWKLLRRRLSVAAPRVIVRSHLPWPLRWAVAALALGFSAALALWAFDLGKGLAGLDRPSKQEVQQLRAELEAVRTELSASRAVADSAQSLLRAERAAQDKLTQQLRRAEEDAQSLRADLGFFERLLPSQGQGLAVRAFQAERQGPAQVRWQVLVMQSGKLPADFAGRLEVSLSGTMAGRPWAQAAPDGGRPLQLKQYVRIEGVADHPPEAQVSSVQVRVVDPSGAVRAAQSVRL